MYYVQLKWIHNQSVYAVQFESPTDKDWNKSKVTNEYIVSYITVCSWFYITRLLQGGIIAYVLFCGVLTMLYRLFNRPGGNGVAALFGPNQFFSRYVKMKFDVYKNKYCNKQKY